jgi:hypothetical protein
MLPERGEEKELAGREAQEDAAMSVLTEVISLEGIDLEGSPPCECVLQDLSDCGKPADFRLVSRCSGCHAARSMFACTPCWSYIRLYMIPGRWQCAFCGTFRLIEES